MSWVTAVWAMVAAACLTLAAVHFPVWVKDRTARPSLFFSMLAMATAALAFCELAMMHAQTPAKYAAALRSGHVAVWVLTVSFIGFVQTYFKAGRPWLAWLVGGLRTASLIPNFLTGVALNYTDIGSVRGISFLGETVSIPVGSPNPWMLLGQAANFLLVVFIADASLSAWRRGDKTAALAIGGASIFFSLAGIVQVMLIFWGAAPIPITISIFSLGVVVAMAYQLSRNVLNAARLVKDLRESEERMTLAAEAANLGIWMRDIEHGTFWASPNTRTLFGFAATETIDLHALLLRVHADDRDAVGRKLSEPVKDRYQAEFRVNLPEGGIRWLSAQGRFEFEAGKPVRARGACGDITRRKEGEQEMLRLRHEIAHAGRVSVMGQLAAALAHEINQPLGAILRNAEAATLLLDANHPDRDELRAIVQDIVHDDQRAGAVIDRMRSMLRRNDIERRPLSVDALLVEVAALVRPDAAARHVRLVVEAPEDLPQVVGDRVHLQQVLLNLISNGMDAIDEAAARHRKIVVKASLRDAQSVEVAVCDSGPGIPASRIDLIFESFFTTKACGMGMGLSISRSLIEAHGGRLWADRNGADANGACLRFTLPLTGPA
ncbi:sensor histidine kinase [Variovorax saccharolyticus]|uniref:sensor histidine kinase n=1 Tax=Variovorax saccharolyticus TaxID=3053516 RepID=UPI0025752268|nr:MULTISPECIES: ATP-binding protein [unclassified Variovorax]MDM0022710.1 ATP-binding protein [Variovorax sp. J22R187]MDM0029712.1 ATP-binding protein [Variovorax sp. J31P216]